VVSGIPNDEKEQARPPMAQSLFFAGADFGQSAARTGKDYTNLVLQERGH
jgi:hypothetical protein